MAFHKASIYNNQEMKQWAQTEQRWVKWQNWQALETSYNINKNLMEELDNKQEIMRNLKGYVNSKKQIIKWKTQDQK